MAADWDQGGSRPGRPLAARQAWAALRNQRGRLEPLILVAIASLAFLARLIPVLRGGGLDGVLTYDDGVYHASAVAFVNGLVPYRDFLMLHPPGILLVLAPFAALGGLLGDATAFELTRVAIMALGAANAVLVVLVARRAGRVAGLCAGLLYAVWEIAAFVERTTWLVAPQNTLLLLALLVLPDGATAWDAKATSRRAAVAGGLLGLAVGIQLWAVIPVAVVLGWLILTSRRQPGGWRWPALVFAGSVLGAIAIVGLPFLIASGPQMLRFIIIDQFGRVRAPADSADTFLRAMAALPMSVQIGTAGTALIALGALIVAVVLAITAWWRPVIRLWVALFGVQSLFLLVNPVFFLHYAGWVAPAGALSVGTVAAIIIHQLASIRRLAAASAALVYTLGLGLLLVVTIVPPRGTRIPVAAIKTDLADARCVTADSPVLLIITGALRRDLERGCPVILDPSGTSFDMDRGSSPAARARHIEYQRLMEGYYGASDAALFIRLRSGDGFRPETWTGIKRRLPSEVRRGPVTVLLPALAPTPTP